jgi:hypothetical protein
MWRDSNGVPMAAPEPISFATASGEAVLSPDGEVEDTGRDIKTAPTRRQ